MSSMKFHQLQVANDSCNSVHPRDMSPIKSASVASQLNQHLISLQQMQQQQRHQQEAAAAAAVAAAVASGQSISDDEEDDEDFDELNSTTAANFYESFQALNHQQRNQLNQAGCGPTNIQTSNGDPQQQQHGSTTTTTTTANSFLMDKNKKLFPQKLWELIHNPSIQHCLRWSQDGQRVYLNRNEFEQYYLKTPNNQFHTQKAISFVRQMNMYGFRKVDDCYYENDNFRRDRKHLLKNMIRRHPNKGLFVGLDHHQLAAAAAAQQALQVNQQLQQLENQHKQRAEQALRLNNYLNQQHQQHPAFQSNFAAAAAAAAAAASINMGGQAQQQQQQQQAQSLKTHQHHQNHSSPFDQMSSQLVARAAAASQHYSHQLAQSHQHQQQFGENLTVASTGGATENSTTASSISPSSGKSPNSKQQAAINNQQQQQQKQAFASSNHQTKKSRLLNNFYASQQQLVESQQQQQQANGAKLDHLSLSLTQAGSHTDFQAALQQAQADVVKSPALSANCHNNNNNNNNGKPSRSALVREAKFGLHHHQLHHNGSFGVLDVHSASNGNSGSAAAAAAAQARQAALHETLVRSLLQLKQSHHHHHKQQDLVAALTQHHHQLPLHQQQQSQRTLLESLASLSSAGTGSIVDPASNSPTERTATPPSGPPSPNPYSCADNMALDLAKSSSQHHRVGSDGGKHHNHHHHHHHHRHHHLSSSDAHEDYAIEVDGEDDERERDDEDVDEDEQDGINGEEHSNRRAANVDNEMAASPLDGTKKVRKFLEDQMARSGEGGAHDVDEDEQTTIVGHEQGDDEDKPEAKRSTKRELCEDNNNDGDDEQDEEDSNDRSSSGRLLARAHKRIRLGSGSACGDQQDLNIISKLLVSEICNRRGDLKLNEFALDQAAKYTQCFLDTLIDDASLIASHAISAVEGADVDKDGDATDDEATNQNECKQSKKTESQQIDASSLSLALKLIPAKLIAAIQQQQLQMTDESRAEQSMLLSQDTEQQQVAVDS